MYFGFLPRASLRLPWAILCSPFRAKISRGARLRKDYAAGTEGPPYENSAGGGGATSLLQSPWTSKNLSMPPIVFVFVPRLTPGAKLFYKIHVARGLAWRCQCVEEIVDSCLRRNDIFGRSHRIAPTTNTTRRFEGTR